MKQTTHRSSKGNLTGNRETLDRLFREKTIDLARGNIFDRVPSPSPIGFDFDRFEGMMLGLAVGDSLGNRSEGMPAGERIRRYGTIRDYLSNPYESGRPVGLPSDDTQLSFWTLEQMLEDGGCMIPDHVARKFVSSGSIFGSGKATREFVGRYKGGTPWDRAGVKSSGNGTLMRIAPVVFPHLRFATESLWVDAALLSMLTHNDSGAIASCVAFTAILWDLLSMERPPHPEWWAERFVEVARDLEADMNYRSNAPAHPDYQGPIWRFVAESLGPAFRKDIPVRKACDGWYSGAYLLETVPSVLYILMRHANDPEEAIVRAVNDTWDNDTVAAVVGAAVGALHGKNEFPKQWIDSLSGRTGAKDDGKVFEILRRAKESWAGTV